MPRFFHEQKGVLTTLAVLILVALSCLVVVPETKQAVVLQLGQPNRVVNRFVPGADFGHTGAGLTWRIPFLESIVLIDKRMLSVTMERQQVLSTDQQPLEVDAFARFRIIDPVRMARSVCELTYSVC